MEEDYVSQRKPLLSDSGKHRLYTDSTNSSINVDTQKTGVTFEKHITLFGAVGILTGKVAFTSQCIK